MGTVTSLEKWLVKNKPESVPHHMYDMYFSKPKRKLMQTAEKTALGGLLVGGLLGAKAQQVKTKAQKEK